MPKNPHIDRLPVAARPPEAVASRSGLPDRLFQPASVASRGIDPLVDDLYQELIAQERARALVLVERGRSETLEQFGSISMFTTVTNVVSYTVPNGRLAEIRALAVVFSHPMYDSLYKMGWRLSVDGAACPGFDGFVGAASAASDRVRCSVGSIDRPMSIEPVYVRQGSTIVIDVDPGLATGLRYSVVARLSGRLWRLPTQGV